MPQCKLTCAHVSSDEAQLLWGSEVAKGAAARLTPCGCSTTEGRRKVTVPSGQTVPQVGALWTAFQMAFQLFLALSWGPWGSLPRPCTAFVSTEQPRTEPP